MGLFFKKRARRGIFKGNKKGVTDILIDFWSYVVYILFIIIFFFLFKMQRDAVENKITADFESLKADYNLNLYLRSPAEVDINSDGIKENISYGEYVAFCSIDEKTFCDDLKKKTTEYFDRNLKEGWDMKIRSNSINFRIGHSYGLNQVGTYLQNIGANTKNLIGINGARYFLLPYDERAIAKQEIPSWDGRTISIEFSNWVIKVVA